MIPALLLGTMFGLGALLVLEVAWGPAPPAPHSGRSIIERLEGLLGRAGFPTTTSRLAVLVWSAVSAGLSVAVGVLTGWPVAGLIALAICLAFPVLWVQGRGRQERAEQLTQLADGVDRLRAGIAAGLSLAEGVLALATVGPPAWRERFAELARDLRLEGLAGALLRAQKEVGEPAFDLFAIALLTSERVGGRNLGSVLESLAQTIRGRVQVESEVRAQQARIRVSARIVSAMPVVIVLVIHAVNPAYLAPFGSTLGQLILLICAMAVAASYPLMLWLGRLPQEPRVRWRTEATP